MFVSFFVFSVAAEYTMPFKYRSPLKQFLMESQRDLEDFIYVLIRQRKT